VRNNHNQVKPGPNDLPSPQEYDFKMPHPQETHAKLAAIQIASGIRNFKEGQGKKEILPMIPKKTVPPSLQDTMGTEGWGLHARQGFSQLKIMSWIVLTSIVGFAFVIFWLTFINKTDLQNAFIPVIFLSSMIMLLLGIPQFMTSA
jgi:hypothetical protein